MFRNMMTPKEAYQKCLSKRKRIIELEEIITTDPDYSYLYAYNVIKGPWKRGEDAISKNSYYSYRYARDVIKEPFERGEKIISKDPYYSYNYARNVIKGPFEKCHLIIFNSKYKNEYIDFLKSIKYDLNKISEWLI